MKKHITLQLYESFEKVNFYTFKFEDSQETETEKFFSKFKKDLLLLNDLYRLTNWIYLIGEKYGAKIKYFRPEASAEALPPPNSIMLSNEKNNLRLYCIRVSDEIVILANGGIKTSQSVQDSPNVFTHFRFINSMSKQINELIKTKEFKFEGKNIINLDDLELKY